MSAESENAGDIFADKLASFDEKLQSELGDAASMGDIRLQLGRLLSISTTNQAEIRKVLHQRYESGELRKETFQLVDSMLDRFLAERAPTSPAEAPGAMCADPSNAVRDDEDTFGATTVIPRGIVSANMADTRVQVGSVLRDRFLLQEKISGGSMGVVYKAMDRRLAEAGSDDHWVAVKVLSPQLAENVQALRALQQEATKGRCLVHPNIVRFIDLDRDDDLYFLIMEWLEGRTLADILDSKDGALIDHDAAFGIVRQIGDAIAYAHRCGIVHADIKPGNIMILPDGDAKLFDFGVARVRQQESSSEFDPGVLGAFTPAYSSMQVLTGEDPVPTDDVFSLSCLTYRLLAGYRVFGPRDAAAAAQEGMHPQRPNGISDRQWRALKKGLAYSRVTRFGTVREFLDEIDAPASEPPMLTAPECFADETEVSSNAGRLLLVLIATATLAAAYQFGYLAPLFDYFGAGEDLVDERPQDAVVIVVPTATSAAAEHIEITTSEPESAVEPSVNGFDVSGPDPMLVDFALLPAATNEIAFATGSRASPRSHLTLREGSAAVIVDFVRDRNLEIPLTLRLEEIGFSGNRSPWGTGQFALSNSGLIVLPAGQRRGRITLSMASDNYREADQQSTLRLREAEFVDSELAVVVVTLEDDDQRAFESGLPSNTVGFSVARTLVHESDPAVQINFVRLNPDQQALSVDYWIRDITALDGLDYFAPGGRTISFGPGQRSARLLVPLVRDAELEEDEAFVLQLDNELRFAPAGINRSVIVVIQDDEPQAR